MSHATILVVDDDPLTRGAVAERLRADGYDVLEAANGREAIEQTGLGIDLALLDNTLPDIDGVTLLARLNELDPDALVIVLTAPGAVDTAVSAMKAGAYHVANTPLDLNELRMLIQKALETTRLRRELRQLRMTDAELYSLSRFVGESAPMKELEALLRQIAGSPVSTVLLIGGSASGTELAAKVLHYNSVRRSRPFMSLNCSDRPESSLACALFGRERGAFAEARRRRRGLLELADGGTIFLDAIGDLPLALQAQLLRFLEERTFKRVGGASDIHTDVRVVAATDRDLEEEVRAGRFRQDLFHRLHVVPVRLPTLRTMVDDLPAFVDMYIDGFNRELGKHVRGASPAALRVLSAYDWPGNIRELRNVIERAMLLTESELLEPADFPLYAGNGHATLASELDAAALEQDADEPAAAGRGVGTSSRGEASPLFRLPANGIDLEQLERTLVSQALERSGGNQTRAALLLGLNRDRIRYRIEKFGLTLSSPGSPGSRGR